MPSKNKDVKNKTNLDYYYRHRERLKEKSRTLSIQYYHDNKELLLSRAKRSREKYYEKTLYRNVKSRCKGSNIPFNITLDDIVIPEYCPYLKIPLTKIQGKGRVWSNASIDRIIPELGYVKGNIEIISGKANLMKAHSTKEELITFAKSVLERSDEIRKILNDT